MMAETGRNRSKTILSVHNCRPERRTKLAIFYKKNDFQKKNLPAAM